MHKTMTLDVGEFMRRFLLHVLPTGFHRIWHYGIFANAGRKANLALARALLHVPAPPPHQGTSYRTDCANVHLPALWCAGGDHRHLLADPPDSRAATIPRCSAMNNFASTICSYELRP